MCSLYVIFLSKIVCFTADGQLISLSSYRALLWDLRPDITSCRNVAVWNLRTCFCGTSSLTKGRVEGRSYFTTDGRSVSQYVLVSSTFVGLATRYYFLSECCCLKFAVLFLCGALSDERTGLQFAVWSLNGPSRSETVTILYCLNWDPPPTWRARFPYLYPPGAGWPSYTPGHRVKERRVKVKSRYDWRSVGRSASVSWRRAHFGTCDQILILSEFCCLVSVGRPLWREVGSVSCQSLSALN
jgi:hypothetical protein